MMNMTQSYNQKNKSTPLHDIVEALAQCNRAATFIGADVAAAPPPPAPPRQRRLVVTKTRSSAPQRLPPASFWRVPRLTPAQEPT